MSYQPEAFAKWRAGLSVGELECRVQNRHMLRGITGADTILTVDTRQGVVDTEETCMRCGAVVRQVIGLEDGFLMDAYGRQRYEYGSDNYLMPPGAGEAGGTLSRAQRAELRRDLTVIALQRRSARARPG